MNQIKLMIIRIGNKEFTNTQIFSKKFQKIKANKNYQNPFINKLLTMRGSKQNLDKRQNISSFTGINVNSVVYIDRIGYGTIMECENCQMVLSRQVSNQLERKQSIYFDPELFSLNGDNLRKKISQAGFVFPGQEMKIEGKKSEGKGLESIVPVTLQQGRNSSEDNHESMEKNNEVVDIVGVRLEGTKVMVYTPSINIRKYIIIPIRPLFVPSVGILNVKIQITKTVQWLKKEIFDLLGLKHGQYFNIKLFTTSPSLLELNYPGRTIWQYGINQESKLMMTAEHGFAFENITYNYCEYFSVVNNNLSLIALPRKQANTEVVASNVVIALLPPPIPQNITQLGQLIQRVNIYTQIIAPFVEIGVPPPPVPISVKKVNESELIVVGRSDASTQTNLRNSFLKQLRQNQGELNGKQNGEKEKEEIVAGEQMKQREVQEGDNCENKVNQGDESQEMEGGKVEGEVGKKLDIPEIIQIKGDKYVKSGNHYFQVRLEKLPTNKQHLKIGVISSQGDKKWYFSPLKQLKSYSENGEIKMIQRYGISFKQNDNVGVLIKIDKNKKMRVIYYRNSIGLGICFEAQIDIIGFVFSIGSEGHITLETRIQPPLDSYRLQ